MCNWVAAVDGGGSKTHTALLAKSGEIVELAPDAGCNPLDNAAWEDVLGRVMTRLIDREPDVGAITMGMPGYTEVPKLDRAVQAKIAACLGERAMIVNDVEMAFHGAFPSGEGILLLAGTGSMTVARGPNGLVRAGGWGDLIGDEGSAYWIGRHALRRVSQEFDGRTEATGFSEALCADMGLSPPWQPSTLLSWLADQVHPRSAIATLAVRVDDLALAGNRVASDLLTEAARHIAKLYWAARARAGLPDTADWATAGSVFRSALLSKAVEDEIGRAPIAAALPPLGGGLLLAARRAGWNCDAAFIANLMRRVEQISSRRTSP